MRTHDAVRVTTLVAVAPPRAFALFTEELDLWWRHGPRHRTLGTGGMMQLEPGEGGRLLEHGGVAPLELGRVVVWEPPVRLVLRWRGLLQASEDVMTEVEVGFVAEAEGTRVTIEHRGWDLVPAEQRSRSGLTGYAFEAMLGLWWADLLVALRAAARR